MALTLCLCLPLLSAQSLTLILYSKTSSHVTDSRKPSLTSPLCHAGTRLLLLHFHTVLSRAFFPALCSAWLPEANPWMLVFSTNTMITLDEHLFQLLLNLQPFPWPSELWGLRLHAPGSFIKLLFAFGAPPGIALGASCLLELLVWLLDSLRQP